MREVVEGLVAFGAWLVAIMWFGIWVRSQIR